MRRLYLAASGLGLSVAVSLAMANPPVTPANVPLADVTYVPVAAEPAATEEKAADPETVLRQQYLKLMHEKAELMDQAELEAALPIAQQDIREFESAEPDGRGPRDHRARGERVPEHARCRRGRRDHESGEAQSRQRR